MYVKNYDLYIMDLALIIVMKRIFDDFNNFFVVTYNID